ncbi:hypothetical protein PG991_003498 [Apiospora marii]|uniref:NACHT domain-containing protein n=1 Tax=Apiospora marii TaxID=335849 RepID=A0ABR1S5U4_9PEZI
MATGPSPSQNISHIHLNESRALIGTFSSPSLGPDDFASRKRQVLDRLRLTEPADDRDELQRQKGWRVPGTCQWIRDDSDYQQWLHGDLNRLWISGGPGMGKTMLSIFLTEDLEKHTKHNNGLAIYYFCRHDDENRNTEASLLRGLLLQLVRAVSDATFERRIWPLFATLDSAGYTPSNLPAMWRIFSDIISSKEVEPVYCVLDGLDECTKNSFNQTVRTFHTLFHDNSTSFASTFRLVVVSRDLPGLSGYTTITLSRQNSHIHHDIKLFISSHIQETLSHKAGFSTRYLDEVSKSLFDDSEESFLWIGFVVQGLSEYETPRQLTKALNQTPKGLGPLYKRILLQIYEKHREQRHLIFRLLVWVSLAFRPLTIEELTRAVMGSVSHSQKEDLTDFLSYCKHLLVIDNQKQTARLVHASAKEFLVIPPEIVLSNLVSDRTHIYIGYRMITRVCLALLERNEKDDALRQYAVEQWLHHIKACRAEDTTRELSRPFFKDMTIVQQQWSRWRCPQDTGTPETLPNALHAATHWGIAPWVENLLRKPTLIRALAFRKRYRDVASPQRHRSGLDTKSPPPQGSDPEKWSEYYNSALHLALSLVYNGYSDTYEYFRVNSKLDSPPPLIIIIDLLLQHLRDPTWFSVVTSSEFLFACWFYRESLALMFLKRRPGVRLSQKTTFQCPALVMAARSGHNSIAEILLGSGADPESMYGDCNAFREAITSEDAESGEKILSMLLDKYDEKKRPMRTTDRRHVLLRPLKGKCLEHYTQASMISEPYDPLKPTEPEPYNPIKQLDRELDLSVLGYLGRLTTFFTAITFGRCVEVCLERSKIGRFSQPRSIGNHELTEALRMGHISVAQILLENGANVNTINWRGCSVLILAMTYGDWDVGQFLVHQGADINLIGPQDTTALIEAVRPTAFKLDDRWYWDEADDYIRDKLPAFRTKKLQMVSQLLRHGASTHCRRYDGRTALSEAADLGDTKTFELLVDHGAKIRMDDAMPDRAYISAMLRAAGDIG